jgi:uncharacterized membrane protein (UPF0127 family)
MIKLSGTIIGFFLVLIALPAQALACPLELPMATVSIKGYSLTVQLAANPPARACGLSHRQDLPQNQGMLFIFPDYRPETFWMKDTQIPLSIAFLDDSGKIINIQDMAPMQTDVVYPSSGPAKYALEVNQGWFKRHEIEVGNPVAMELPLVIDIK